MNKQKFIMGTMILIIGNIITRLLGFVYRIYISNAIGAEGMGLFHLIFPIYSLIMTVTTSGISMAVSNLVAEEHAKKNTKNIQRLMRISLVLVCALSIFISFIVYTNINWIATRILKDPRTYYSLLVFLPCIPIITATSVYKGYFYGAKNMLPSAVSQFIEQIIRIATVMSMLHFLQNQSLEMAAAYAVAGMMLGELAGCFYIFYVYRKEKIKINAVSYQRKATSTKILLHTLLAMSIPISLSRLATSLLQTVESIMIPSRLQLVGLSHSEAISVLGKFSGMAMPLIFFPAMITMALSTNLIPTLSEAKTLKQSQSLKKAIYLSVQFTLLIGFLSFGLFYFFGSDIAKAFYKSTGVGGMLQSLSVLCIFLYLEFTLYGILNGLGKQMIVFINGLIGSFIRLIGIYYFVPLFGIQAIILSFIISMAITCILNLKGVVRSTGIVLDLGNWAVLPCGSAVLSGFVVRWIWGFSGFTNLQGLLNLLFLGVAFTGVYLLCLLLFGCISLKNIRQLLRELKIFKPSILVKS